MGYLLGIDVGTTRTAAAIHRTDTPLDHVVPEMITLGDRSIDQPSVVFLLPDGTLLVGDAAERRAMAEPDRVAREFKRRIGDPTPVTMGGRAFAAQELAAVLVRHVLDVVTQREGGPPDRITVTHPASWGTHKLDLLAESLAAVLPMPVEFLGEPQAAAVCYAAAERVEPGSTIAVYDLGGGTFDSAVVRKEAPEPGTGGFTLLGRPEGLEFLGGVDFDEVVFEHVRAGAADAFAGLDESDPAVWAAVARLRRECREAKEALSADTEVSVPVWLGGAQTVVRLHRSEFEELIGPRIEDSVEALRRAVASAGLDPAELSSVLLVGGSSRIPLVAQTVSERLARPVAVDADPKNAIAKGAVLTMLVRHTAPPVGGTGIAPAVSGTGIAAAAGAAGGLGAAGAAGGAPLADAPGPLPWMTGEAAAGPSDPPTSLIGPSEAATAYVTTPGNPATAAWTQDPKTDVLPAVDGYGYVDGYGHDGATTLAPASEPGRGRSPALLIGAGGVVAAVAVVGALVFWPNEQNVSNATPQLPAVPSAAPAPPPTEAAPTTESEERQTRERTIVREPAPVQPAPPPAVPTQPPAPPTSVPPTTSQSAGPTTTTSVVVPPPPGPVPPPR